MVRISTVFDEIPQGDGTTKKSKVFMVRGDEGYAHQTQPVLKVLACNNPSSSIQGYKVYIKYDVVNDIGSSSVVLMDNDDVLGVYDWTDTDGETTIGSSSTPAFYLNYGVEHNLYLKYKGNNKCLASKSDKITITQDFPSGFITSVVLGTHSWSSGDLNIPFTLKQNGETGSSTQSKDVFFYLGDELVDTVTTNSSSTGTAVIDGDKLKEGINTIDIEVFYDGTLSPYHGELSVEKGELLTISEYPTPFIKSADNTVKCLLTDFNGNPISGTNVTLMGSTDATDSNGIAEFTFTNITSGTYHASTSKSNSADVEFKQTEVTGVNFISSGICVKDYTTNIRFVISTSDNSHVPSNFKILNYSGTVEVSRYFTSNTGGFAFVGTGGGHSTAKVTIANLDPYTVSFYDYLGYANITDNFIMNIKINGKTSNISQTSNGYVMPNVRDSSTNTYYSRISCDVDGYYIFECTFNRNMKGKLSVISKRGGATEYTNTISSDFEYIDGTYKIQRNNNNLKVFKGNTLITTLNDVYASYITQLGFRIEPYNSDSRMIVSKVKCYQGVPS